MNLSIGFSTCPNDTFIFDAMVNNRIDTEGLSFSVLMADVEELNQRAFKAELDITKMSFHAFAYASDKYILLNSGSALGKNNGPLLISKTRIHPDELKGARIAIPGKYTTANLLLRLAFPEVRNMKEYLFSEIEEAILSKEMDAGVIIHETRFTYHLKGLQKIVDLGELWEGRTGHPTPLGGIAIKRNIPADIALAVNRVLRRSIEFAFANPEEGWDFIKSFAVALDDDVIKKHIDLYVNPFSADLGKEGKAAITGMYDEARKKNILPVQNNQLFIY
jgi:1,4-dihydroxy-6-naphthoate synthase